MVDQPPRFTVVVPTYNRSGLLGRAVQSVLDQTVDDVECIVVDDASPIGPQCPDDQRVRVVRREVNGGSAAARNTGLRSGTGTWVTFLDDDDYFLPNRLAVTVPLLDRDGVDAVVCWEDLDDGRPNRRRELQGDVSRTILDRPVPHTGATLVRRAVVPEFDERLRCGEDAEWWLRLANQCRVETVRSVGLVRDVQARPHHGKSSRDRLEARLAIIEMHADYFARNRRAAADQWIRVGHYATQSGDLGVARRALGRALLARPNRRVFVRFLRSFRRSRADAAA